MPSDLAVISGAFQIRLTCQQYALYKWMWRYAFRSLAGKLTLITGSTGGIGRATAIALAKLGCNIAVHYNSASEKAVTLIGELKELGVKAEASKADLGNYNDEVRALHGSALSSLGNPSILFNNAGITLKRSVHSVSEISVDEFEHTWRVNCGITYLLTQLCLPAMEEDGWGRVIFSSSAAGFMGGLSDRITRLPKSALHGLIHRLSQQHARNGITVNGVAPALIEQTAMLPTGNEQLAKMIPVGRLGIPQEIADTVVWMVKTGYVTNKVVCVDGGIFAQ